MRAAEVFATSCTIPCGEGDNEEAAATEWMHRWSEPPGHVFFVRGAQYLEDRVKYPSGPSIFPLLGLDLWQSPGPMRHFARHHESFVQKLRRNPAIHPLCAGLSLDETDPAGLHVLVVNFLLPSG